MSIGYLPRLPFHQGMNRGVKDWSDQLTGRLEYLFGTPPQIGIPAISQFVAVAGAGGYLTIPTTAGSIIVAWGTGSLADTHATGTVTFSPAFPGACWLAIPAGADTATASWSASGVDKSGFTINCSSSTGARAFAWIAIGN